MPTRSSEINRVSLNIWSTGVGATNFNLIDLSGYKGSMLLIDGIEWGSIIQNATDRTNFISQYCALLKNAKVEDTSGISTAAPLPAGGTVFTDIVWMQSVNNLAAYPGKMDFATPLPISGGENCILVLPAPSLSAGITTAIYTYLEIRARVVAMEQAERLGKFRLV